MLESPKISIIIPTSNSASHINESLTSIATQDYKNIEVVVMDASSSDNTLTIIDSFKDKFNISLTSEKDKGIYDAMNKGVKKATGEWILFMGSDDTLYGTQTIYNVFNNPDIQQYDIIYGDVESEKLGGRYGGEFSYARLYKENICHQAIFFKRDLFNKLGYFDLKFINHADWEYNFRWMGNREVKHIYVDEIICNYSDEGISSTSREMLFPYYKDYACYVYGKRLLDNKMRTTLFQRAFINLLRARDIRAWIHLIIKAII